MPNIEITKRRRRIYVPHNNGSVDCEEVAINDCPRRDNASVRNKWID